MKGRCIVFCLSAAALHGCGGDEGPVAREEAAGAAQRAQAPGESERDFDALDVCELIPGETVAMALDGTLSREPMRTTIAGLGTQCLYTVAIDGMSVDARISLSPAAYWIPDEDGRVLDGLGDEAYATETDIGVNGTAHDIYVLVRGDAEVNVTSNTFDRAEILAELALESL